MITEDYVSFETAKLLKEKGFNETSNTIGTYNDNGMFYLYKHEKGYNHNHLASWYSAPTLQMAMKWLREVYNLFISIYSYPYSYTTHGWSFLIHPIKYTDELGWNWDDSLEVLINKKNSDDNVYSTYEECCEKAIKHCLENLI